MILEKLNPAVDRKYLILLAGIVWCGVGIMLITFATTWLIRYDGKENYLTVIIMVSMGIALRHSRIPKQYLSIIYNEIGLALFLSGIRYLRHSIRLMAA